MFRSFVCVAVFAAVSVVVSAGAQTQGQGAKTVTKQNKVTSTATIKAIDQATRSITLRAENGDEDTFTVGPEVTRFDQLKVGDTIMVSSTQGADPKRLTAIALVTGADTLLNMVAARQQAAGGQPAANPAAGLGTGINFGIGLP